jgi:hypothetical protein
MQAFGIWAYALSCQTAYAGVWERAYGSCWEAVGVTTSILFLSALTLTGTGRKEGNCFPPCRAHAKDTFLPVNTNGNAVPKILSFLPTKTQKK